MRYNILVLGGSIRAKDKNRTIVSELAYNSKSLNDFINKVKSFESSLSNSEIIAAASMTGAIQEGSEAVYFPLIKLFPPKDERIYELQVDDSMEELTRMDTLRINQDYFGEMLELLDKSTGVILSTPVYFGDRSSVANKFLQIASIKGLLKNKIFGMVSVGAKRNGGQETANIFGLYEAINQGALAVGNGPPTSQYGGTAVGGDKGHVIEDEWGLKTAMGTGTRVAQVSKILKTGLQSTSPQKIHIVVLVSIETRDKILSNFLHELLSSVHKELPWVEYSVLNLTDLTIYRCLGCNCCPVDKDKNNIKPHCNITASHDGMEYVRGELNRADGAIMAGLNIIESERLIFRYQVTTERMRYLRRNNFELTNLLFTGLCYHQFGATVNPIHTLKTMVSYIRHNTIIHCPIEIFENSSHLNQSGKKRLIEFCHTARAIKCGLASENFLSPVYEPYGYGEKRFIK